MITGIVTDECEAVIRLRVRGPSGREREIEAVIDTGFNGWISLPVALISALDLPWRRRGLALLADGSESVFDMYDATLIWDGRPRRVAVDAANTAPLVGMALLDGCEMNLQIRAGGAVTIRTL